MKLVNAKPIFVRSSSTIKKKKVAFISVVSYASCSVRDVLTEVGKLLQVQNGTPPSTNFNGVDAVHACNMLQQLKALYDEAQLTDIVVEVDHGKTFSCHRNVLAAISPYFR